MGVNSINFLNTTIYSNILFKINYKSEDITFLWKLNAGSGITILFSAKK